MYVPGERGAVGQGEGVLWIDPACGGVVEHPADARTAMKNKPIGVAKLHVQSLSMSVSSFVHPLEGAKLGSPGKGQPCSSAFIQSCIVLKSPPSPLNPATRGLQVSRDDHAN